MHKIQRHILHCLIQKKDLKFSELKPKGVESNLFIYHLNKLFKEGLVKKTNWRYNLTPAGKRFVDKLSLKDLKVRIQPKIVTLVACKNDEGEYLLYQRSHQPFIGMVGFPYGKIHLGETVLQAAIRELKEKTGVQADMQHRGDVYLTTYEGKDLISQSLCHIFSAKNPKGDIKKKSPIGKCFWSDLKDLDKDNFFPGFKEVLSLLKKNSSNKHFFAEYMFKLRV